MISSPAWITGRSRDWIAEISERSILGIEKISAATMPLQQMAHVQRDDSRGHASRKRDPDVGNQADGKFRDPATIPIGIASMSMKVKVCTVRCRNVPSAERSAGPPVARAQRSAEIALENATDPVEVLHRGRIVQSHLRLNGARASGVGFLLSIITVASASSTWVIPNTMSDTTTSV